jgi:hypothetical protein
MYQKATVEFRDNVHLDEIAESHAASPMIYYGNTYLSALKLFAL